MDHFVTLGPQCMQSKFLVSTPAHSMISVDSIFGPLALSAELLTIDFNSSISFKPSINRACLLASYSNLLIEETNDIVVGSKDRC